MIGWVRVLLTLQVLSAAAPTAFAQSIQGRVVDQTGLPLPGASVQLRDDAAVVATVTTGADGTFAFDPKHRRRYTGGVANHFWNTATPIQPPDGLPLSPALRRGDRHHLPHAGA